MLATFLLTGARRGEVFGLEVGDIDFSEKLVRIRPNVWRSLKRDRHARWVPLWPQLRRILQEYLDDAGRTEGLLFPNTIDGGMVKDLRESIGHAVVAAKIEKRVTPHTFRLHVRRGAAPDARPWGAGEPLHRHARAGPQLNPADRADLRPPDDCTRGIGRRSWSTRRRVWYPSESRRRRNEGAVGARPRGVETGK